MGISEEQNRENNKSGNSEKDSDTLPQSISKTTPGQGKAGDVHPGRDGTDSHSSSCQPERIKHNKTKKERKES